MANINFDSQAVLDYQAALKQFLGEFETFSGVLAKFPAELRNAWNGDEASEAHAESWTRSSQDAENFKPSIQALIDGISKMDENVSQASQKNMTLAGGN